MGAGLGLGLSLRLKIVLSLLAVAALAGVALALGAAVLVNARFVSLENRDVSINLARMEEVLSDQMSIPATKVPDWANWDDAFEYATTGAPAFAEANLIPSTLDNAGLDALRVYSAAGEKIGGVDRVDAQGADFAPLMDDIVSRYPQLVGDLERTEPLKGWVRQEDRLFAVASMPIRPGTGEGAAAGTMLFVKEAGKEFTQRVAELAKFGVSYRWLTEAQPESGEMGRLGEFTPSKSQEPLPGLGDSQFVPSSAESMALSVVAVDLTGARLGVFEATLPRDVKLAGQETLRALLLGAGGVLALMFVALMAAIERFVVRRVRRINQDVDEVEQGNRPGQKQAIAPQGNDEIGRLATSLGSMLATIDEKTAAMRDILSNVATGFLMVDDKGIIQPGHTDFCHELLSARGLGGKRLAEVLFSGDGSKRNIEAFELMLEQAFSDILPEDMAMAQLPREVHRDGKWLSLSGRVLRRGDGSIRAVLFTLADVTQLKASERKVEDIMALMQCLQARDVFASLIDDLPESLDRLRLYVSISGSAETDRSLAESKSKDARKILHTLKGNFAMFGLGEIARLIHGIEDSAELKIEHMDAIESSVRAFLSDYSGLLGLIYGEPRKQQHAVSDDDLQHLARAADKVGASAHELRSAIQSFSHRVRLSRVIDLLAPIARAGNQLAARLGKNAVVEVCPTDVLVDHARCHALFDSLINAVRNAVDHGMEHPGERTGKSEQGRIELRAWQTEDELFLEIKDDGRGVHFERLGEALSRKGLCTVEDYAMMSEQERLEFLFSGLVSTAESVTEISGRGLGLSGLRSEARNLGGDVVVTTQVSVGTSIRVCVPLRPQARRLAA
jgi:sensor domain CHASE-containing protein/signal transduction histidine kinase